MLRRSISTRHGTPNFTVRTFQLAIAKNDVPFGHFKQKIRGKVGWKVLFDLPFDAQMCTRIWARVYRHCLILARRLIHGSRFCTCTSRGKARISFNYLASHTSLDLFISSGSYWEIIAVICRWESHYRLPVRAWNGSIEKFPRYVKNVNNKTAGDFIRVSPVAEWFDTFTRHSS